VGFKSSSTVSALSLANSSDFPAWLNPIAITEYDGLGADGCLQQSF